MAPRPLSRAALALFFTLLPHFSWATNCQEVSLTSKSLKRAETIELCFLGDRSYFISRNCQDLACGFMRRIKQLKLRNSLSERPGATTCRALRGGIEQVSFEQVRTYRCVFPEDRSSISLNLLESWDGKSFHGPAPALSF